jgi:hypothetical protein
MIRHFKLIKYASTKTEMIDGKPTQTPIGLYKLYMTQDPGDGTGAVETLIVAGLSRQELLNLYDVVRGA